MKDKGYQHPALLSQTQEQPARQERHIAAPRHAIHQAKRREPAQHPVCQPEKKVLFEGRQGNQENNELRLERSHAVDACITHAAGIAEVIGEGGKIAARHSAQEVTNERQHRQAHHDDDAFHLQPGRFDCCYQQEQGRHHHVIGPDGEPLGPREWKRHAQPERSQHQRKKCKRRINAD
jgi:hypothetical protein